MPQWSSRPSDEPAGERRGPVGRALGLPGRTKLLIAVGVVLVAMVATRGCTGADVSEESAVATARAELDSHPRAFVPEKTQARVLRQGFPSTAMWVVVFTVQAPDGGPEDFLRHAAVWVHAGSGNVERVEVDEPDGSG
ncbi:MAG: hypothetical protein F4017_01295 [Acidimicrobiaceae bacterium]|nr:hypothetical protein [Acidimicrobiaceae bacterium]MYJ80830.1 hypothetical protein [Acidimicrobiaceae bacterium]MYK73219.1 hypothetical protein [Acidimicrobiaceae bacterium]